MSTADLEERIRHFYSSQRGYDWNIQAAANLAAGSPLVLSKISAFVDEDGWIEWDRISVKVDRSGWSSGEKGLIRLACSLACEVPQDADPQAWSLASMTGSLDQRNSLLVVEALRYATLGPDQRSSNARMTSTPMWSTGHLSPPPAGASLTSRDGVSVPVSRQTPSSQP